MKTSRTDVEALDLTDERLRRLQDAFTEAADRAHETMDRYADREDTGRSHPVREDDQRAHRPEHPGPHHGREAGRRVHPMAHPRCIVGAHRRCTALSLRQLEIAGQSAGVTVVWGVLMLVSGGSLRSRSSVSPHTGLTDDRGL
ncbi:hypothetical protein GCM10020367_72950 [Streptomyces sannanensis]|uniref:Uncharacterized protein n=1 Tax=Streptomyces sannanensis TaxID=285536 RepID=A0ABP6SNT3_9ACTN